MLTVLTAFKDDICGISLSDRTTSCLIMVWNRDADHVEGVQKIFKTVVDGVDNDLKPREGSYYYKRHSEHAGFKAPETASGPVSVGP
jgi:hypothetical protein